MDTASLLRAVKRRARLQLVSLPSSQISEFFEIINETFENDVIPTILSFREEYYNHSQIWDTNNETFEIPSDAVGQKVRGLYLLDTNGNRARPVGFKNLETSDEYSLYSRLSYFPAVTILDNTLYTPTRGERIEVMYYRMPNTLVNFDQTSNASYTTNNAFRVISSTTSTLSLRNPGALITLTDKTYDIISSSYPFRKKGSLGLTTTNPQGANPQTATFTGDQPDADDWLFETGVTGFANIPREMNLYFILACAAAILNFNGAAEFAQVEGEKMKQLDRVKLLLDPRNDGQPWVLTDSRGFFDFN